MKTLQIVTACLVLALCGSQIGCGRKAEAQTPVTQPAAKPAEVKKLTADEQIKALESSVTVLRAELAQHDQKATALHQELLTANGTLLAKEKVLIGYAETAAWWLRFSQVVSVIGITTLIVLLIVGPRQVLDRLVRLRNGFSLRNKSASAQPSPNLFGRRRGTPVPADNNGTDDPGVLRMAVRDAEGMRLADPVAGHLAGEQVTAEMLEEFEDRGVRVLTVLHEPELVGADA